MSTETAPSAADLVVIGAGPGGYVAAIRAAQCGLETVLVERGEPGGVCLNHGCIPSKALIEAARHAGSDDQVAELGVERTSELAFDDFAAWQDSVVSRLTGGVQSLCRSNGVTLVEGTGSFVDDQTVEVQPDDLTADAQTIAFDHAIVATGSRPLEIPGFDYAEDHVLSSRDVLDLEGRPDRLVVVGAGYIGMELASVYAKLGTDVKVVEMLDDVLPPYEDDVSRVVKSHAKDLGVAFHFGYAASDWEETADGGVRVSASAAAADGGQAAEAEGEADELELEADKVLVAVGRSPVTDTLNLEATGLEPNDNGFLETDDRCRTDVEHIMAVGDVAGEPMLAHKGSKEGQIAAEVVAGEPSAVDYQAMPAAVFTEPEIGTVGLTQAEAEEQGFEPVVGKFPFQASGRALTTNETDGFVRIVADEPSGFVLGAQIVGSEASELIAELGLAIEMGATLEDVASTVHTHPTLAEAVMEAAENALGHAIHTLNR